MDVDSYGWATLTHECEFVSPTKFPSIEKAVAAWNHRPEDYSLGNLTDWVFVNMQGCGEPEYSFYSKMFSAIMEYRREKNGWW